MLLCAGIAMAIPAVQAGSLSRAQVSANAKWVLHLDIERFGPSQTCRYLQQDKANGAEFRALLTHYRNLLGVDPLKDLTQVTLYGEEVSGDRGVALISGALNPKYTAQRLASYPKYQAKTVGTLNLHKWRDASGARELNACFYSARLLLIGSDERAVLGAAAVLQGDQPNLGTRKTPGLVLPVASAGTFLTAASKGYAGSPQDPLKALILRNTEAAMVQVAENKGLVDAGMVLNAVSPEGAFQIHQILNGLVVSASLTSDSDGLAKLAEMSDVSRQDRLVKLSLHCPARDAAAALATTMLSR